MIPEPIAVTLLVVEAFDTLGIPYFIGGSLASFERRMTYALAEDPVRTAFVASPEDNILAKLEWYRPGDEVSERPWSDIVTVVGVQGDRPDRAYLRRWAPELGVAGLLERALRA